MWLLELTVGSIKAWNISVCLPLYNQRRRVPSKCLINICYMNELHMNGMGEEKSHSTCLIPSHSVVCLACIMRLCCVFFPSGVVLPAPIIPELPQFLLQPWPSHQVSLNVNQDIWKIGHEIACPWLAADAASERSCISFSVTNCTHGTIWRKTL